MTLNVLKKQDTEADLSPSETAPPKTWNKKSPMCKKAYDAFNNAKQRCENANNPSYPEYGAKGIKFLLPSFDEFLIGVGLPSAKLSLDRIDPNGHYEVGNLRWASPSVQALNKKGSAKAAQPSISALVAKYQGEKAKPELRARATGSWARCLSALGRGYFLADDVPWFQKASMPPEIFKAGFELGQPHDCAEQATAYFHLPSLTWPGRAVRLTGGPIGHNIEMPVDGSLRAFGRASIGQIVPTHVFSWLAEDLGDVGAGAVWIGQVTATQLSAGGIEGWMLVAAARASFKLGRAVLTPVLDAVKLLYELGHPAGWENVPSPILDARFLFIPDLQIDLGDGFEVAGLDYAKLRELLRYRRTHGHKTFVGIQNVHKLPENFRAEVLGYLRVRELEPIEKSFSPTSLVVIQGPALPAPPAGGLRFHQMRHLLGHI
jgi:hypothetical protein